MKNSIDLNCDLGEGIGNDAELLPYLSSCNIACGGHAGDDATMQAVVKLALKYHVKIGAHPSYPDKKNFGRAKMTMSEKDLKNTVSNQIRVLKSIVDSEGSSLHHVKPHGSLYNQACQDKNIANTVIHAIREVDPGLILFAPYQSTIAEIAKANDIEVMYEAFADRNYQDDLSLVSRQSDNALITDAKQVLQHVLNILQNETVLTEKNKQIKISADTLCVHSDTDNATEIVKHLCNEFGKLGINIE